MLTISDSRPRVVTPNGRPVPSASVDGALAVLAQAFARAVEAETCLLVAWDPPDEFAWIRASCGLRTEVDHLGIRPGDGAAGRFLRAPHAAVLPRVPHDGDPVGDAAGGVPITTVVGAPVRSEHGVAGALCAGRARRPGSQCARLLWTAEAYAGVAALCLEGSGFLGALAEAAGRDHLTGCLNLAALERALAREVGRCERHERRLACCFVDLDDFKRINDTYGHTVGNRVLAATADALRDGVRGADFVGRYGGDEFVVVLPETGRDVALDLALRLRAAIEDATEAALGEPVGASAGVAEWTPGCTVDDLLGLADHGLRIAKEAGGGAIASPAALETPGGRRQLRPAIRRLRSLRSARRALDG